MTTSLTPELWTMSSRLSENYLFDTKIRFHRAKTPIFKWVLWHDNTLAHNALKNLCVSFSQRHHWCISSGSSGHQNEVKALWWRFSGNHRWGLTGLQKRTSRECSKCGGSYQSGASLHKGTSLKVMMDRFKSGTIFAFLGCSLVTFWLHFESQPCLHFADVFIETP